MKGTYDRGGPGQSGTVNLAGAVADVTAPAVSLFSPVDDATGVAIDSGIVVTFNEAVFLGSGKVWLKLTSDDSTVYEWDVETDEGGDPGLLEITNGTELNLYIDLVSGEEYYITWEAGVVEDSSTNPVAAQASTTIWSFTTVADVTAPAVSSFNPVDDATGVLADAELIVIFDEDIILGAAGTIALKLTADNTTIDSWDVAIDEGSGAGQVEVLTDSELHFYLTADLGSDTEYYVIWDAAVVEDLASNPVAALASTTAWSFTTGDSIAPSAISFVPVDNDVGVSVETTLIITFDEPVVLGLAGTISLKFTSDDSTVHVWDVATDEGTGPGLLEVIGDDELWLYVEIFNGTEYYIVWDVGIVQDLTGNPVAAQSSTTLWSFTTMALADREHVVWTPLAPLFLNETFQRQHPLTGTYYNGGG